MHLNLGTETPTVQQPIIKYAGEIGWHIVSSDDALTLRMGENGTLFYRVLEDKLIELNPGLVTEESAAEIVRDIEAVRNNIEGNAEILSWLRGEQSIYDDKEKRRRNVTVVDFEHVAKNIFQVTDEWQYTNGRETNRADIMFLINGIPVAIVEAKSAKKANAIEEALIQIREYHHETPEMLTAPQVFDITHLIHFYYGSTWNLERKDIFNWKDEEKGNFEKKVKRFFDRERFLKMLKEWILFYVKDDELRKTILRQHQTRAVEKVIARCANPTKKTGLIWHTQGSGKTFTMITAARQILANKEVFGKATVILMIDRNELEGQLSGWVERILGELKSLDIAIEPATSKARLRELLASDFRGLIISMIHKFERIDKDICTRDNVIVLVDEAHRSFGRDLGNYLVGALPDATLIGFTGTPIDKTAYGKGTFKIFGKEDKTGYLDKYSIAESIEDGTTLSLNYTLAPNDIRVPLEQLEKEFLELADAEGVSDVEELNKILDKAVNLKTFLKSADRIKKVSAFVAKHFQESIEPLGYKAFLVAVDREACALYKEELDKILPHEYTLPMYTAAQHDSEKYPLVYKHQLSEIDENNARKLFPKPKTMPRIFIVTDKLLTGFDAPILYSMYLDKPMRDHVLLQAIARVNRPYEEEGYIKKPCGLVVDFVGIFEKLEKALAFDSDVVSGVIKNLDVLKAQFFVFMTGEAQKYLALTHGRIDDRAIEAAIDVFVDQEKRELFYKFFKELEMLYEILSPSPDLRNYVDDFGKLSVLYQIVRNAFRKKTVLYGDITRKTELLVREKVVTYGIKTTMPVVKIDEKTLEAIRKSGSSDKSKIINLINSIGKTVNDEEDENPYLRTIGDRAEQIQEAFDERQISTKEALKKIEELIQEIVEARRQQKETGFDIDTFTIFWVLKQEKTNNPEKLAPAVNSVFERFPDFRDNPAELRELKAELYKLVLPTFGKERMVGIVEKLLKLSRK
ncbi:MAG: deoxyribonuclease HsdR [Deltaproteobacteria bacterium CG12_big_fil_rev_8_21_14_0_65_43_10]|nr:MAG: deoxyribonuclease HsdR [Deltaproteobacteria bacterium CG2_30_43_15]PIQ46206.1 MAG: deoxyribonuclease HsdR [Deltaproteobacteria bacterium CG12_big_fil_rev_8_21_14_0_65_43_10]PIU86290.1 MAG: deoxyribonuclease HsdR [Deltaproteobacteria bacterium CG06_land_8_20_14_3_00_44_19]PIX21901.1 MAG: deoxyribonuclease HsdR [Deltaproteobacteria bacterium CG_4_8_14_3_um_filter_43_13]PIZ20296.1 MAG: deoxyribonuclease HsdR [Deltaproteobacteria bacterium CG_4_10_14_0_8_um_filter_43_12]PJB44784.1 MAG: deo